MHKKTGFIVLLLMLGALLASCTSGMDATPPPNLNTATTRKTDKGLFTVTIKPDMQPIAINQIHTWTLHVESADGKPVENAEIKVDGGMPQHGHGLPTEPKVTEYLGAGDYKVEGVKFQMTGWWEVKFNLTAAGQTDTVTFNLVLS